MKLLIVIAACLAATPALAKGAGHVSANGPVPSVLGVPQVPDHFYHHPLTGLYQGRNFTGTMRIGGHNYSVRARLDPTFDHFNKLKTTLQHVRRGQPKFH